MLAVMLVGDQVCQVNGYLNIFISQSEVMKLMGECSDACTFRVCVCGVLLRNHVCICSNLWPENPKSPVRVCAHRSILKYDTVASSNRVSVREVISINFALGCTSNDFIGNTNSFLAETWQFVDMNAGGCRRCSIDRHTVWVNWETLADQALGGVQECTTVLPNKRETPSMWPCTL